MRCRTTKVRPVQHDTSPKCFKNETKNDADIIADMKNDMSKDYINRSEIKKKAIQVFHTEPIERKPHENSLFQRCISYYSVLHPNGLIRRIFDFITVIWVLLLVFFIPFLIGFDWYVEPKGLAIFLSLLDVWFAIDIVLNFRTGYIHHGTVIMTAQKIFW